MANFAGPVSRPLTSVSLAEDSGTKGAGRSVPQGSALDRNYLAHDHRLWWTFALETSTGMGTFYNYQYMAGGKRLLRQVAPKWSWEGRDSVIVNRVPAVSSVWTGEFAAKARAMD